MSDKSQFVALYPLSSPNHNLAGMLTPLLMLRYILFHHQTTTARLVKRFPNSLRYILFHHQTTTCGRCFGVCSRCVISSFITKPQHAVSWLRTDGSCVISSFITKPQLPLFCKVDKTCCVISSFITKPQHCHTAHDERGVALYPLSSPNHNISTSPKRTATVALYPLSSPNHNLNSRGLLYTQLRYILFHHQTTTCFRCR